MLHGMSIHAEPIVCCICRIAVLASTSPYVAQQPGEDSMYRCVGPSISRNNPPQPEQGARFISLSLTNQPSLEKIAEIRSRKFSRFFGRERLWAFDDLVFGREFVRLAAEDQSIWLFT